MSFISFPGKNLIGRHSGLKYLEKLSKLPQTKLNGIVTKLVAWTHIRVLAQAKTLCLSQGASFSAWMLRLEQHKLHSMAKEWRSVNLVHKSTSQPNLGGDTKYIGRWV